MEPSEKSLRQRIIDYLQQWRDYDATAYVNGGEIERLALAAKYKASNASRRLRELENENIIEKRINNGTVEYRYVGYRDLAEKYPIFFQKKENNQMAML